MRKSRFGIPLLEHFVAAVIFGGVVWAVSFYIDRLLEEAEATVVRATVMNIRSGLRNEQALRILRGAAPVPRGGNPVRFLQIAPAGYLPEAPLPGVSVPPGSWYYREATQTLHYAPKRRAYLRLQSQTDTESLAWRISERSEASKEVDILTVTPFEWF
ncbi:hypothetical protein [Viridibacterium curvum]|uniref:Uncharacterized protein n=1 Tax=Viridibacterium curvum TaxID=1101404 RepID=A0ABP9R3V5_9RHOO